MGTSHQIVGIYQIQDCGVHRIVGSKHQIVMLGTKLWGSSRLWGSTVYQNAGNARLWGCKYQIVGSTEYGLPDCGGPDCGIFKIVGNLQSTKMWGYAGLWGCKYQFVGVYRVRSSRLWGPDCGDLQDCGGFTVYQNVGACQNPDCEGGVTTRLWGGSNRLWGCIR